MLLLPLVLLLLLLLLLLRLLLLLLLLPLLLPLLLLLPLVLLRIQGLSPHRRRRGAAASSRYRRTVKAFAASFLLPFQGASVDWGDERAPLRAQPRPAAGWALIGPHWLGPCSPPESRWQTPS